MPVLGQESTTIPTRSGCDPRTLDQRDVSIWQSSHGSGAKVGSGDTRDTSAYDDDVFGWRPNHLEREQLGMMKVGDFRDL